MTIVFYPACCMRNNCPSIINEENYCSKFELKKILVTSRSYLCCELDYLNLFGTMNSWSSILICGVCICFSMKLHVIAKQQRLLQQNRSKQRQPLLLEEKRSHAFDQYIGSLRFRIEQIINMILLLVFVKLYLPLPPTPFHSLTIPNPSVP